MKTKNWLILLASCVALASGPMMGCGDDNDPSVEDNNTTNNDNNGDSDTTSDPDATGNNNNGTPDTTDNNNNGTPDATSNNGTPDATSNNGTPDATSNNGTPDVTDDPDTTGPTNCVVNDFFTGQAYAEGSDPHAGGNPVDASGVTLDSAGLLAIDDAMANGEATEENDYTVTLDTPLEVTGALVIATGRTDNDETPDIIEGNDWLYLQDADTVIVLNAGPGETAFPDGEAPDTAVKVGDKVSFTATELQSYAGLTQAVLVNSFSIDSSDNDVPFTDLTGQDVPVESLGQLVRVSGELTADNGGCGGSSICYTLSHGEKETAFRSNSNFIDVGSCVTFFGPLGAFDDAAQLNEVNYAWTFTN